MWRSELAEAKMFVTQFGPDIFIIKPTRCTSFPNLLRHETLHLSGSSSAHHQEFIHCTLGTGIYHTGLKTAFEQDLDGTAAFEQDQEAVFKLVWHIPVPSVQWINSWWWADELPETCRFSCRSKFGKLVHLVGFIIKKFVTMHGHMNVKNWLSRVSLKTLVSFSYYTGFILSYLFPNHLLITCWDNNAVLWILT